MSRELIQNAPLTFVISFVGHRSAITSPEKRFLWTQSAGPPLVHVTSSAYYVSLSGLGGLFPGVLHRKTVKYHQWAVYCDIIAIHTHPKALEPAACFHTTPAR